MPRPKSSARKGNRFTRADQVNEEQDESSKDDTTLSENNRNYLPKPKSPAHKGIASTDQMNEESNEISEDETDSSENQNINSSAISKQKFTHGKGKQVQKSEDSDISSEDDIDSGDRGKRNYVRPRQDLRKHQISTKTSPNEYRTSSNRSKHSSKHDTSLPSKKDRTSIVNSSESSPSFMDNYSDYSDEESTNKVRRVQIPEGLRKSKCVENSSPFYFGFPFLFIVSLLVIIIAGFLVTNQYQFDMAPESAANATLPRFEKFVGHIKDLEHLFPNQNQRLWRTVKSSAMHVLQHTESNYPVVILMASGAQTARISRCIAKKITSDFELTQGLDPKESAADIHEFHRQDPAQQKQTLDGYLSSAFNSNQRKSFVIENLQLLHPEAALLLHGYCDSDNAPYKDVMLVLLLNVDKKDVVDYSSTAIENYLEQLWSKELDVDKVKALLSRVANNIVIVEEEDSETFNNACS